jgi:hypothetical protein
LNRRLDMNAIILGILTKTAFLALGMIGLWLGRTRSAQRGQRRQILPLAVVATCEFSSPARAFARRLIIWPSPAPPGMTNRRQLAMTRSGLR